MMSEHPVTVQRFQKQCKDLVKSKVFLGHYQEKRYVESLNAYRDIITLSDAELDLKSSLNELSQRISSHYKKRSQIMWFGYTNSEVELCRPAGQSLYTELHDMAFGHYWFQVKTIRFPDEWMNGNSEILLKVEAIRALAKSDYQEPKEATSLIDKLNDVKSINIATWNDYFAQWKEDLNEAALWFCSVRMNAINLLHFLKFLPLLAVSLSVAAFQSIHYIGSFTIIFLTEFRKLVKALMPLFLGILELFSKLVGGFYLLIAMIWRDSVGPGNQVRPLPQIRAARGSYVPHAKNLYK